MFAEAHFIDADKLSVSVTITQTLREWKLLVAQLEQQKFPSCELFRVVRDITYKIESKAYEGKEDV